MVWESDSLAVFSCVALVTVTVAFAMYCVYFARQFHQSQSRSKSASASSGSVTSGSSNLASAASSNAKQLDRRIHIIKISIAICGFVTGLCTIPTAFLALSGYADVAAWCSAAGRLTSGSYCITKFFIYLFLFLRGRVVSFGHSSSSLSARLEVLVFFGALGLIPFAGLVTGLVTGRMTGSDGNTGSCGVNVQYELAIVMLVLDACLSGGYVLVFILRLQSAAEAVAARPKGYQIQGSLGSDAGRVKEVVGGSHLVRVAGSTDVGTEDQVLIPARSSGTTRITIQPVATASPTGAQSPHPKHPSSPNKSKDSEQSAHVYFALMKRHLYITALTATSSVFAMALFAVASIIDNKTVGVIAGFVSSLDLLVNTTSIAYLTHRRKASPNAGVEGGTSANDRRITSGSGAPRPPKVGTALAITSKKASSTHARHNFTEKPELLSLPSGHG